MRFHPCFLALTLWTCGLVQAQIQKPIAQKRLNAELLPSDGQAEMGFGIVAVSGNIVAVAEGEKAGSVYLYSRLSKGTVTEIAKLTASDGAGFYSVAVGENGRLVVAGALNQRAVYVFTQPDRGWTGNITEIAKLTASDGGFSDHLGVSVSTTNGAILAGAYQGGRHNQGEAYVYVKPANGWTSGTETAQLKASNGHAGDSFGITVSISGHRAVVGAVGANNLEGIAYVFQESVGGWKTMTETAQLSHSGTGQGFGAAVAVSTKTVVVGAPGPYQSGGAAYVYVEPPGGWVSTKAPTAVLTETGSGCFGSSVAIGPQMIAVGDYCVKYGHPPSVGDSVAYLTPQNGWHNSSDGILLRPKGGQQSSFVAVGRNRVIVGAPQTAVGNNVNQGAAFIFSVPAR